MNTKEAVAEWDKVLDEYEKEIGLGSYVSNIFSEDELNTYFQMSRNHIEKLTPEECVEIAYRLGQFSLHTQRTINRENARIHWAEENIKEAIADELNNYKGYGYIEKSSQAIKHNERANKLNQIKKYATQRSDRLQFVANSIKNLSDIMMTVSKTKVIHG